jgi:hypothetical protein
MVKKIEEKILAFHSDPKLKEKVIRRMQSHIKADELLQGTYGRMYGTKFEGCAISCMVAPIKFSAKEKFYRDELNKNDYDSSQSYLLHRMETDLGIPQILGTIEEKVFEGLYFDEAKEFVMDFLNILEPGCDYSKLESDRTLGDYLEDISVYDRQDENEKIADKILKKIKKISDKFIESKGVVNVEK